MSNPKAEILSAELAAEITQTIQHLASKHNYMKPDHCHVVPQALLMVLSAAISFNFNKSGHKTLVERSAERLTDLIVASNEARSKLTPAQLRGVNPMAPCSCDPSSTGDTDDLVQMAKELAEALGLDPSKVTPLGRFKNAEEAAAAMARADAADQAIKASDDPANMAKVEKEVDALLSALFGKRPDEEPKTKH